MSRQDNSLGFVEYEYDIGKSFDKIENELIASMIRNMERHRAEELKEGYDWEMWQALQLKQLEKYKKSNAARFKGRFKDINSRIENLIRESNKKGYLSEEIKILDAIKKGFFANKSEEALAGAFFRLNERKLNALVRATVKDMSTAETAILRMANDRYRRAIFDAQVYANTGAGTYEKAVDMATKDMLAAGLKCVEYSNGARHTLANYARMAIRTANKRAYLQGEGTKRREWGLSTVIVNKRGGACPLCLPFVGKVMIDDVWSGGKATDGPYMLLSSAISDGFYHPNCKDSHSTYFPMLEEQLPAVKSEGYPEKTETIVDNSKEIPSGGNLSQFFPMIASTVFSRNEIKSIESNYRKEQLTNYANRQIEKYSRLEEYSLDGENIQNYSNKKDEWTDRFFRRAHFKTGELDTSRRNEFERVKESFNALPEERVVNILRKESEDWIKSLSKEEITSIRKYTYNSGDKKPNRFFERINAMLRGEMKEDKRLKYYADKLSCGINKNKLNHKVIAYRGCNVDFSQGAKIGESFISNQFISSSVIKSHALGGDFQYTIFVREGARASYIEKLSYFPKQRELLLDRDTIFRVLYRQGKDVYLEVI